MVAVPVGVAAGGQGVPGRHGGVDLPGAGDGVEFDGDRVRRRARTPRRGTARYTAIGTHGAPGRTPIRAGSTSGGTTSSQRGDEVAVAVRVLARQVLGCREFVADVPGQRDGGKLPPVRPVEGRKDQPTHLLEHVGLATASSSAIRAGSGWPSSSTVMVIASTRVVGVGGADPDRGGVLGEDRRLLGAGVGAVVAGGERAPAPAPSRGAGSRAIAPSRWGWLLRGARWRAACSLQLLGDRARATARRRVGRCRGRHRR